MNDIYDMKELYEAFLGRNVQITKRTGNKLFFYHGVVLKVFNDRLLLCDRKIGNVVFMFDLLAGIEENNKNP